MKNSLTRILLYLASVLLVSLLFQTVCRVGLCLANAADSIAPDLLLRACLIGLKFDNLICCYIIALPLIVLSVLSIATSHRHVKGYAGVSACKIMSRAMKATQWFVGILMGIVLFVEVANIRYYHFFDNHLNWQVTEWFGFAATTAGMLFSDHVNLVYLLLALAFIAAYEYCLSRITKAFNKDLEDKSVDSPQDCQTSTPTNVRSIVGQCFVALIAWGLCFVGIRGSLQRYPLGLSFAYFCDNAFYNKLGINPVFNIIKTAESSADDMPAFLRDVDVDAAEQRVAALLSPALPADSATLQRCVPAVASPKRPNVVLVLMESMMALNLQRESQGMPLTPFLRRLRQQSVYCSCCFSAGVHTNNGIVASQYGVVPQFAHTAMPAPSKVYTGLPYYLKKEGYSTHCFVTSNPQYDNMNSFLRDNSIDNIYSQYDYPADKVVNNFGVADDYLFEYGVDKLSSLAESTDEPFYALFVTVSNHTPYVIPERYMSRGVTDEERMIAFCDDALRVFVEAAQATSWGQNTVFVLVADHGSFADNPGYDMPINYNAIPLYIFGSGIEPREITTPASQIDICPTVLSMLGVEYVNSTLGIDLMSQQRQYAFFVNNDHLGCSDGRWLYCISTNTQHEALYLIGDPHNRLADEPERAAHMRRYATDMMVVNCRRVPELLQKERI